MAKKKKYFWEEPDAPPMIDWTAEQCGEYNRVVLGVDRTPTQEEMDAVVAEQGNPLPPDHIEGWHATVYAPDGTYLGDWPAPAASKAAAVGEVPEFRDPFDSAVPEAQKIHEEGEALVDAYLGSLDQDPDELEEEAVRRGVRLTGPLSSSARGRAS